jgi:voltage-gated potassium channel
VHERAERWQRWFEWLVLFAAAMVIPVIAIEESDARGSLQTLAAGVNWAIWSVFLAEVVLMLAIAPNRWRWLREHPLDIAIVVLTPPFLPASLQALRAFRLLRLLRLLRALQAARRLFSPQGFRWAALLTLLTTLCGGAGFAAVERGHNDHVANSWDGVWWAVSTMTTVGYGDVSPATDGGRAIAIVVMVVGIGFLSMLIGVVAQQFVEPQVQEVEAEVREVGDAEADIRAELREMADRLLRIERRLNS